MKDKNSNYSLSSQMNKSLDKESISRFREKYEHNKNKNLEKRLREENVLDVCLNNNVIEENKFEFNVELEDCKIYHQYSSLRCWLFSCLNLIKNDVAHNLNIDPMQFQLSANYLSFYDKLEKSNHVYQVIIDYEGDMNDFKLLDYDKHRFLSEFLKEPCKENGRIEYARELIKKYGLVPYEIMPETINTREPEDLIKLFHQKVRCDLYKLIEIKLTDPCNLYNVKEKMLEENYSLLCTLMGQPPIEFNYKYNDINGKKRQLKNITPIEFYNRFCKINLDDFIVIGNLPQLDKPYFKKYRKAYSGNIEGKSYVEFINLPQNIFTELCIEQLKNRLPVCFSCEIRKYRSKDSKILDTRLFNVEKLLKIKDLTKGQALDCYDIFIKHWMVFKGVHIENNKPIRWKVEDSYGIENRTQGYYVMNHNFFEKCVFQAWIDKRFIPQEILEIVNTEPILFGYNDSI